jgi:hypothetical protein
MHIEEQRWAALSGPCAIKPGGFGWSEPLPSSQHPNWWEVMDVEDHQFMLHADFESGKVAGAVLTRGCTEFASYPHSWLPVTDNKDTIDLYIDHGFGQGKPARIIDIDISLTNPQQPFDVILAPNWGVAARNWWWGYNATDDSINKIRAGQASGKFTNDGIKKKLVSIARQPNGRFAFVMNELKPADVDPHYRHGMSKDDIKAFLKGEAWQTHPADGIKRRLISAKRHAPGNWTILYVPDPEGLGHWFYGHTWGEIATDCQQNNRRVIYLERYADTTDRFTAVQVKNK